MHTTIRANTQRWIALVLLISAFCLAAMPNGSQAQRGSVQADTASSKRVPMSHLYVTLSDAMAESKSGRDECDGKLVDHARRVGRVRVNGS